MLTNVSFPPGKQVFTNRRLLHRASLNWGPIDLALISGEPYYI